MSISAGLAQWAHRIWQSRNPLSLALYPLSLLTALFLRRKKQAYASGKKTSFQSPCPVVVVGNLVVGGTGKTPVVIALTRYLQAQGWNPGIISRGYGIDVGPTARCTQGHAAASWIGDEPAMLANATQAPVCIHPQRALAAQTLLAQHPNVDVLISDDGMQHLALQRDLEIAVQDQRGIGNGYLLPAGPLRDHARHLQEVDWLITQLPPGHPMPHTPAPSDPQRQIRLQLQATEIQYLYNGERQSWANWLQSHRDKRCAALAGIGQPERFFNMLRQAGLTLEHTRALADHAVPQAHHFSGLKVDYILITRKDAVKYQDQQDTRIVIVDVEACFSNPQWLDQVHESLKHIALRQAQRTH